MLKGKILKTDNTIYKIEKNVIFILLMLMLALSFIQIILRIFFNNPILIIEILIRSLVMITCLLASSIVTYHASHFRIEITQRIIQNTKIKKILQIFTNIFVFVICFMLFLQTIKFIRMEVNFKMMVENILNFNFEPSYISIFLPVVFLNMSFHALTNLIKDKEQ